MHFDPVNEQIIDLLRQNARMSYSEIGNRVGISRTAVKSRIDSLESSGVIKGYKAVIDYPAAPGAMTFITTIETEPNAFDSIADALKIEPCVVTLCQISGDSVLHAVCVAAGIEEMRVFAKRIRASCPGMRRFTACHVWEVMKGSLPSE